MDIVKRNFLNLLRRGALDEDVPLEAMSDFKWNALLRLGRAQGVGDIVGKAMASESAADIIPLTIRNAAASAEYAKPAMEEATTDDEAEMSNFLFNKRLDKIRDQELHAMDTSVDTLQLLNLIVRNAEDILTIGIYLRHLLIMGRFLRTNGANIDFVKLETWLQKLQLQRMALLEGSLLVALFSFETDEIAFIDQTDSRAYKHGERSLRRGKLDFDHEKYFVTGREGVVRNNPRMVVHTFARCLRFFSYAPVEALSNLIASFASSLSEIEE